jgi:hypothetical protein
MFARKSDGFFTALLAGGVLLGLMFADAAISQRLDLDSVRRRREVVRVLTLTDLCLFTEARYTRHPSMADLHAPFQEHPMSLEHFPSGAVMAVPPHLNRRESAPRTQR